MGKKHNSHTKKLGGEKKIMMIMMVLEFGHNIKK